MAGRLHGENVASCGTRENVGISRRPRLRKYDPARQLESLPDAQPRRVLLNESSRPILFGRGPLPIDNATGPCIFALRAR
jgi:hypothetical protein